MGHRGFAQVRTVGQLLQTRPRVSQPKVGGFPQSRRQGPQAGTLPCQAANALDLLERGPQPFVQIGGLAVRAPICVTAHPSDDPVVLQLHHRTVGPDQSQDA